MRGLGARIPHPRHHKALQAEKRLSSNNTSRTYYDLWRAWPIRAGGRGFPGNGSIGRRVDAGSRDRPYTHSGEEDKRKRGTRSRRSRPLRSVPLLRRGSLGHLFSQRGTEATPGRSSAGWTPESHQGNRGRRKPSRSPVRPCLCGRRAPGRNRRRTRLCP